VVAETTRSMAAHDARISTAPGPTHGGDPVRRGSRGWGLAVAVIALVVLLVALAVRWRTGRDSWPVGRGGEIELTDDACRAFDASGRWNRSTVFLNAGHGGTDPGAVPRHGVTTQTEKVLTHAIVQEALPLLRDAGFRVVLSRTGDSSVALRRPGDLRGGALTVEALRRELMARIDCANAARADVLVSVHLNSHYGPSADGAETFYNTNREFSARSRALASHLHGAIVSNMRDAGWQVHDRGVAIDDSAGGEAATREPAAYGQLLELGPAAPPWFTRPSRMPGVIIEPLFLTNPDEARRVTTAAGRTAIARGVVEGIEAYFATSR
jgi:N-acetylmuramoyl-L-alanine amidase